MGELYKAGEPTVCLPIHINTKEREKLEQELAALKETRKMLEYAESISTGKKKPFSGYSRVAGYNNIKEQLNNDFLSLIAQEQAGASVKVPNAILFYGPMSTGKTTFMQAIAEQSKCHVVELDLVQSDEKILEDLAQAMKESKERYELGQDKQRTVILIDEMDALTYENPVKNDAESARITKFKI